MTLLDAKLLNPDFRVGILVPPANPTVEPEMRYLLPAAVGMYVTRFAPMADKTLDERNLAYLQKYPAQIHDFGALKLDAVSIGLTGPSYRNGPQDDAELCGELGKKIGIPVATASLAIAEALRSVAARSIVLVSPYPDWLTRMSVAYWEALGVTVCEIRKMSEEFRAYELTTPEVAAQLAGIGEAVADAVVLSGTGMLTVPAILQAANIDKIPFLSSNICSAWWIMRELGIRPSANFNGIVPQLAL